jgi:hypothetical protein
VLAAPSLLELSVVERIEVVEDRDFDAISEQRIDDVTANESGATGDQDVHATDQLATTGRGVNASATCAICSAVNSGNIGSDNTSAAARSETGKAPAA